MPGMDSQSSGKVGLVTGGCRGLGETTALGMAPRGGEKERILHEPRGSPEACLSQDIVAAYERVQKTMTV
jgi:NAD(P)-dependent dehydrogenase (short-subunit alcohol dehydrogenase family)